MLFKPSNDNKSFFKKILNSLSELVFFIVLFFLPAFSIWISFYHIQKNLLEDSINECLSEMSEITAHMLRKTEPETYYQESVRRLSESFKWAEKIEDIPRIESKDLLEFALFDVNGTRLKWPINENLVKTKFSQDYIKAVKRFANTPGATPTQEERKAAIGYSGNEMTLATIAGSPNTLINFQGIGLRKMGGWFKVQFATNDKINSGDLLAWLNLEKLDKYSLAERTIESMQKLTNSDFTFSFIDLKQPSANKSSRGRKLKKEVALMLSSNSLKSNFIFENELFALNDTQDGIRLICSRPSPKPILLIDSYNRLLAILVPVVILLIIWKFSFNVKFNFSIKTQAFLIFGFSAIIGFVAILISAISYQYEKQITLTQKNKNEAIEILEKVDQQYTDSFDDLLFQYRNFITDISTSNKNPEEVLAPLFKAIKEDVIAYAVYVDDSGQILFRAPEVSDFDNSSTLAARYNKVVNRIAIQSLRTFNSSRDIIKAEQESASIKVLTTTAVDGLLSGRSKFIETKLDNEETLAFMDFAIDNNDYAKGCLLIIHDPRKLEKNYLVETGRNISKSKDYELIAFPKTTSNEDSYYPRHSYIFEEPLWKLNDMVNQNQLPSFKRGKITERDVIVAAISANNMKNYNLFLAMPTNKIGDKTFSLSKVLLTGTAFSLIVILFVSFILSRSISSPIKILKRNANAIKNDNVNQNPLLNLSDDSSEIENITTGLTNLVLKAREFKNSKNISAMLLPFLPFENDDYDIDYIYDNTSNNTIAYKSLLEDDNIFMFLLQIKDEDSLNASLYLSMAAMVMKLFVENQGIRSPVSLIKNLEESFRISFKCNIKGSMVAMLLNSKTNTLSYSGFGDINLLKINHTTSESEIMQLTNSINYINEILKTGDTLCEIQNDCEVLAISDKIEADILDSFKIEFSKNPLARTDFKTQLVNEITKISKESKTSKNVLYIRRKANSKSPQFKKLAESNPIALIRSQMNRRQPNA